MCRRHLSPSRIGASTSTTVSIRSASDAHSSPTFCTGPLRKFSKTQILEMYLNRVYFGAGAYGIEQASLRYFGKSARQITLAEAALLAGLVKSPSRLAPTRNFDAAEQRARIVL